MKIKNLIIQNFLTIGFIGARLDEKGLVLIQGDNRDDTSQNSNGAGKSSFPDAISWCLFGVTARGETGDAVVNRTVGKDCVVSLYVEDGAEAYEITRYRKHAVNKNQLRVFVSTPAGMTDISKGTDALTQELVYKIVGCSEDVFCSAIYAGQEKMPDLPSMTDKQLKLLVEEAAGINKLQAAHEVAKARLRDAKVAYSASTTRKATLQSQIATFEAQIQAAKDDEKAWLASFDAAIQAIEDNLKKYESAIKAAEPDIKAAEANKQSMQEEIKKITAAIKAIDSEKEEEKRLKKVVDDLDRQRTKIQAERNAVATSLKALKHEFDHFDDKVGQLCGECGKAYTTDDLKDGKAIAAANLRKISDRYKQLSNELNDVGIRLRDAQGELSSYQASMTDVTAEMSRRDALQKSIEEIDEKRRKFDSAVAERNRIAKSLADKKAETNPHIATIKRLEDAWSHAMSEMMALDATIMAQEHDIAMAEAAVSVFGPAGVRAHILDTVTPFLNDRTAQYLSILTDGNISAEWSTLSKTAKGELREKFCISVTSKVGAASFKGLSGGEKRKTRLACAMALQDLVASRASKPIELFIADEIDHALDASGLERLMTILDTKAKERGTVLVISHNDLESFIDQSVTIVKEGGVATMQGTALS